MVQYIVYYMEVVHGKCSPFLLKSSKPSSIHVMTLWLETITNGELRRRTGQILADASASGKS